MIDERFAAAVSAWLRRTDSPSRHAEDNVGQAMAQIRDRHRRRPPWFLPGRKPTAGAEHEKDHAGRSSPTIASTGGIRTMFSATNVAGIVATVALIGAVTLALPTDPQPAEPPLMAPTSEAGGVTTFTSEMTVLGQDRAGDAEYLDWGVDKPGEQYTTRITSSDPRMSGMSTGFQNVYEVGPMKTRLHAWNGRLFTDEGSWLESGRAYQDPEFTLHTTWYSIGEGAYEGLAAITLCEQTHINADWTCHGVISEVGWPEFPPEAPTEIPPVYLGQ